MAGRGGAALLGWFAHPLLLVLLSPLFLVYYLSVGTRHRLAWHLALLGGLLAAIGINGFWLLDWINYWWIRVPPHLDTPLLAHRTFRTVWEAPLWGGPIDKALACGLVVAAATGVLLYNETSQRATARLLGLAWCGFFLLSLVGLMWEPLGRFGAHHLLVPALLFAALPAAHAVSAALRLAWRGAALRWASLGAAVGVAIVLWRSPPSALAAWMTRLGGTTPLQLGLNEDQRTILDTLQAYTTPQAAASCGRTGATRRRSARWTPLLPLLTERAFVGGLDAEAGIEHTANGLTDQVLAGRPLPDWKDDELRGYCDRYNIGWVVCWSVPTCRALPALGPGGTDGDAAALSRERAGRRLVPHSPSVFLRPGWFSSVAGRRRAARIVLGNVEPHRGGSDARKGQVLLSLHHQAGMRVSPSRVHIESARIERAELPSDSIPFVRLWVDEPVTRVTITWDKR